MQAPAPFILDQSMEAVYYKYGWNASDINVGGKEYPTMSELYAEFEQQLLKTNYDGGDTRKYTFSIGNANRQFNTARKKGYV